MGAAAPAAASPGDEPSPAGAAAAAALSSPRDASAGAAQAKTIASPFSPTTHLARLLNQSARQQSHRFSLAEAHNVLLYVLGIMCYKFALETFLGSVSILAADRFSKASAFATLGLLQGLNQAAQCFGSILVAPLVARFPTNRVLACAILALAAMSVTLLVTEAASGGTLDAPGAWNIAGIFPIFIFAGVAHGTVELIRRVIPRDICGGCDLKLRKMDSLVHVWYEVAGTAGAFFSVYLVLNMGAVYANFYVPVFWVLAGIVWSRIALPKVAAKTSPSASSSSSQQGLVAETSKTDFLSTVAFIFKGFFISVYRGASIIFSSRQFIWLIPGYALPLVLHRYLESQLAPAFAKNILKQTAYAQIMVGGSNFGELLGASFVFICTYTIPTPIPWVRVDALTLNLLWVLPFATPVDPLMYAWLLALLFIFISSGWAAGDVSLAAYIQASLASSPEGKDASSVSPLGAVMAFLYTTYIVTYAGLSYGLGRVIDHFVAVGDPHQALFWVSGVMMSIASVVVMAATFIPKGSWQLNPSYADMGVIIAEDDEEAIPLEGDSEKSPEHVLHAMTAGLA